MFTIVAATPPACFLSCINEVAHDCPRSLVDLLCLCAAKDTLLSCFIDLCPVGNFYSARDHYLGTCLEHNHPPDAIQARPSSPAAPQPSKALLTEHDNGQYYVEEHFEDEDGVQYVVRTPLSIGADTLSV